MCIKQVQIGYSTTVSFRSISLHDRVDSISFPNTQMMLPLRIDIFYRWRNSFKDVQMA